MSTQQHLEKKLGNSGPCYMCGDTMFCNETEYQGTKKLQWQNADGKSHWLPNKQGCRKTNGETTTKVAQPKEMDLSNFKPELVTESETVIWNDIVTKVTEYTLLAQKKLQEYPEITNPALKGLISNNAFQVLNQINERRTKK